MSNMQNNNITGDGLEKIGDAARFLCVSRSLIYKLIARGVLPSVKIGSSRRVPVRAVRELARDNLTPNSDASRR